MPFNLSVITNVKDNVLEIKLIGRILAVNAESIMAAVRKDYSRFTDVVIDAEKLDYISSAGLRQFLQIMTVTESKNGKLSIKNANDEVMNVLKMTGFTDVLS